MSKRTRASEQQPPLPGGVFDPNETTPPVGKESPELSEEEQAMTSNETYEEGETAKAGPEHPATEYDKADGAGSEDIDPNAIPGGINDLGLPPMPPIPDLGLPETSQPPAIEEPPYSPPESVNPVRDGYVYARKKKEPENKLRFTEQTWFSMNPGHEWEMDVEEPEVIKALKK